MHLKIAVIVPSFRTADHILDVVNRVTKVSGVENIFVVDDACPEQSGQLVKSKIKDKRVSIIFHETNQGVGGAMISGYKAALAAGADIVVKVDGDGQMAPEDIPVLVRPILEGRADYTKGNRFDSIEDLEAMPRIRIFGNAVLSLMSKVSSGYWNITDPTNGFTAIHRSVLRRIHLDKLRKSFFFESDVLFRLSLIRAVVYDVALPARYGTERSNLKIWRTLREFPGRHFVNYLKRIFYLYYLREWSVSSVELPLGFLLFGWGLGFGIDRFIASVGSAVPASVGAVMISVVPLILGFQLLLAFVSYDVASVPRRPRQLDER
jgi:glycosyltransferase involved in cell wall biosynthesis